ELRDREEENDNWREVDHARGHRLWDRLDCRECSGAVAVDDSDEGEEQRDEDRNVLQYRRLDQGLTGFDERRIREKKDDHKSGDKGNSGGPSSDQAFNLSSVEGHRIGVILRSGGGRDAGRAASVADSI